MKSGLTGHSSQHHSALRCAADFEAGGVTPNASMRELIVAYVEADGVSPTDQAKLGRISESHRELGGQIRSHRKPTIWHEALIAFARQRGITQIFIGHSQRRGWWHQLRGNPVETFDRVGGRHRCACFPQRTGE